MGIKKILGSLALKVAGWKLETTIDSDQIKKCVIIAAPHTSNWDFYFAISSFWKMGIPMRVFIKDDWTKPFYGFIIKWFGGIGVDRSARSNMTDYGAQLIKNADELYLLNTPEGSRSWAEKWKKGFYYMAKKADVPIVLAYGDYKNKIIGIKKVVDTQNQSMEEAFQEIEDYYRDIPGCYPEQYNPKIF